MMSLLCVSISPWNNDRMGELLARAIKYRQENDEAVGGFFSQFTSSAYKDLQSRDETRNSALLKEGWDSSMYYKGRREHTHTHTNTLLRMTGSWAV
ncbi:unnamed protein product, partial [Coregonus sp. 'balchen']